MAKNKGGTEFWQGLGLGIVFVTLGIFLEKDAITLSLLGGFAGLSFLFAIWKSDWVRRQKDTGMMLGRGIVASIVMVAVLAYGGVWLWGRAQVKPPAAESPNPNFELKVGELSDATFSLNGRQFTGLFLEVNLTNHGAPGSLGGWRLHYQSSTLDITVPFEKLMDQPMKSKMGKVWRFHEEDNIYEKTMYPIATGAIVRGWSQFNIPGDRTPEFDPKVVKLTLQVWDSSNRRYDVPFDTPVLTDRPMYWPGMKGLTVSPAK